MRAFEFWDTPPSQPDWRARALQPLGMIYAAATAGDLLRQHSRAWWE